MTEGPLRRAHNHIEQVKPRDLGEQPAVDCPACWSIDRDKMSFEYAQYWQYKLREEAEFERALRQ